MSRVKSWLACGSLLGVLVAGPSCSDTTNVTPIPHAKGCEVEADCDKGLTCTKRENALGGLCHQDCSSSENCAIGDRCVHADKDKTGSTVCQPATEALCRYDSDCFVPLKCGPDQQCRDACKNDYDCIKPQLCTNQHFCAEPYEVDGDKNLIVRVDVNVGGEGGVTSMPAVAGTGGAGGSGSGMAGAAPTETGGAGPGDGGESGQGGAAPGGSGGSSGTGPRSNPCIFDSSGCNPLTVVLAGKGTGSVKSDPEGLDCGDTCTFKFPVARAVVLSAFADEGSVFNGWSGGGCTGDRTCVVTANAAPTITATFSSLGGTVVWSKPAGALSFANSVYDHQGNVIVTGSNTTTVDLGASSPFQPGTFVVKYSGDGSYLWDRRFAGNASASVTTDAAGDVLYMGSRGLIIGTGSDQLDCSSGNQLMMVKFAAADGTRLWSRCYALTGNAADGMAVAATRNGDLVGVTRDCCANHLEYFRQKSSNGNDVWSQRYSPNAGVTSASLALDGDDNVFIGGWSTVGDFGGGSVPVIGGFDGFIMKRTSAGAFDWVRTFGGTENDYVLSLATDAEGNVAFSGRFESQLDFPGLPPLTNRGGVDIIVGKYSSVGTLLWVKQFGGAQDEQGDKIVALPNGDFLVGGSAHGSLDFGGGPLFAPGKQDVFLVQLSGEDGSTVWSKGYGSAEDDLGWTPLSVDSKNNLLVAFLAGGPIDFGAGAVVSADYSFIKMKLPNASVTP
jgi:Divergent InlB B-repeat domain